MRQSCHRDGPPPRKLLDGQIFPSLKENPTLLKTNDQVVVPAADFLPTAGQKEHDVSEGNVG